MPDNDTTGDDIVAEFAGTTIYGADGAVYLIPDDALAAYRLEDEHASRFLEQRDELSDVSGFGMSGQGPPDFGLVLRGTFGRRNFYQGPVILHVEPLYFQAPGEP